VLDRERTLCPIPGSIKLDDIGAPDVAVAQRSDRHAIGAPYRAAHLAAAAIDALVLDAALGGALILDPTRLQIEECTLPWANGIMLKRSDRLRHTRLRSHDFEQFQALQQIIAVDL
jgi:hypothetical protein